MRYTKTWYAVKNGEYHAFSTRNERDLAVTKGLTLVKTNEKLFREAVRAGRVTIHGDAVGRWLFSRK